MGSAQSIQVDEEEEEEEDDDDDNEEEGGNGETKRREMGNSLMKKVLEQEPEMLPCHASASPLSPQLSTLGTPRLGPSIKVWDPYNVLAPPPPLPPRPTFSRNFSSDSLDNDRTTTEVFLISHGECGANLRPDLIAGRWPEATLTPNGKRQARALAVFLKSYGLQFNAIYSSPLDRARTTAVSVCQRTRNLSKYTIYAWKACLYHGTIMLSASGHVYPLGILSNVGSPIWPPAAEAADTMATGHVLTPLSQGRVMFRRPLVLLSPDPHLPRLCLQRVRKKFCNSELNFAEEQIQYSDALIDMSQGQFEGYLQSEVYTPEMLSLIDRFQPDFSAPSGESLREVEFRMIQFLNSRVLRLPERLRTGDFLSVHQNESKGFSVHDSSVQGWDGHVLPPTHWDLLHRQKQGLTKKKSGKSRLQFVTKTGDYEAEDEIPSHEATNQDQLHETTVKSSSSTSSSSYCIGVFTHAVPIKCLITGLIGCSPAMSQKICIDDSSMTVLQHSIKTGWQIKRLNDTAHLRLL